MFHFDLPNLKEKLSNLKKEQEKEDFWLDLNHSQKVNKEIKNIERKIDEFEGLISLTNDTLEITEMLALDADEEIEKEIIENISNIKEQSEKIRLATLLKGEFDENNAIITLHAGAGGTEAQDWVSMLFRLYTRYAERSGYTYKVLDLLNGDDAGIKSVTFIVEGLNAYGYLKSEMGVHRLVRISPFDANKRRHTSFASMEVMPEIDDEIAVDIRPEDLRVDTYRSSGAGGQHVNKTESAIRITHIPTGIVVQCQNERSQIQNRETAMKMLKSKLIEVEERKRIEQNEAIKGNLKKIEWGSQIRSYVFQPYTLVKDHRTGYETPNITAVMDGDIEGFIEDYLAKV